MICGLLLKSWRETRTMTLALAMGLCIVTAALTSILPQLLEGKNDVILQIPLVRTMMSAMTGIDASEGLTTTMMLAVMWTHPVVLALGWAHAIICGTRFPAGEVDRGTIDVLLGWPVSRRAAYGAETVIFLAGSAVIAATGAAGFLMASLSLDATSRPVTSRALIAALNLLAMNLAVGGGAMLASSLSDRKGRAMAAVFGLLAASFLLNFLAQFWEPAKGYRFLSVLEYYQPALTLRDGAFPAWDLAVLTAIGGAMWLAGLEITARRSMCTV